MWKWLIGVLVTKKDDAPDAKEEWIKSLLLSDRDPTGLYLSGGIVISLN